MKTIKYFATLLMLFTLSVNMNAQALTKAQEKAIKKQVKEFQKDGWKIKPGSLSLADQITRSNQAQWEQDADGYDKWIIGEGSSIGTIYDAARTQALTVAQGEISRRLKTDMTSQIEQNLANEQFAQAEAESIAQTIVTAMGKSIDQKINRPRNLIECYRELPNGNVEVLIRAAVSSETLNSLAKAAIEQARRDYLLKKIDENKSKVE
jgi:hypothetical protein